MTQPPDPQWMQDAQADIARATHVGYTMTAADRMVDHAGRALALCRELASALAGMQAYAFVCDGGFTDHPVKQAARDALADYATGEAPEPGKEPTP